MAAGRRRPLAGLNIRTPTPMVTLADAPSRGMDRLGRFLRLAPWFALGPVTGPLAAACFSDLRTGRPVRATVWFSLAVTFWIGGPMMVGVELSWIHALHQLHH
jgi:hypothetical protein